MKLTESGYKYTFRIFPNAEQQSLPRRVEMIFLLFGGRIEEQRRRLDGKARGRLQQRALGARLQQEANAAIGKGDLPSWELGVQMLAPNAAKVKDPSIRYRAADVFTLEPTHDHDVVFFKDRESRFLAALAPHVRPAATPAWSCSSRDSAAASSSPLRVSRQPPPSIRK